MESSSSASTTIECWNVDLEAKMKKGRRFFFMESRVMIESGEHPTIQNRKEYKDVSNLPTNWNKCR